MENVTYYKEEINKRLEQFTAEGLAHLLYVVELMSKSFEAEKEEEQKENTVNREILQNYITEVRGGFELYFEKTKKLNASYHIGENLTYTCFSVVDIEVFEEESEYSEISIEELLEEKEVSREVFEQKLHEKEKVNLYEESNFYVVKHTKPELWQKENAQKDAKEEIGKILAKLPNYSEDEL